jgi:hypothetical protein
MMKWVKETYILIFKNKIPPHRIIVRYNQKDDRFIAIDPDTIWLRHPSGGEVSIQDFMNGWGKRITVE